MRILGENAVKLPQGRGSAPKPPLASGEGYALKLSRCYPTW